MQEGDDGGNAEGDLKPHPDVEQHEEAGGQHAVDGLHLDLLADGRPELLRTDQGILLQPEPGLHGFKNLRALRIVQILLGADDDLRLLLAGVQHLRRQGEGRQRRFHILHLHHLPHVELHHGAAGEVDADIHAPGQAQNQTQQHHGQGQGEPDFLPLHDFHACTPFFPPYKLSWFIFSNWISCSICALETTMAVNMLVVMPIISVTAKPRMGPSPMK